MRDERAYLFDMADSARIALSYIAGKTHDQFLQDTQLQDAILRRLAIIGEAARCVSAGTRANLPQLPWDDMARMRNILIHVYFGVDMDIVWNTASQDLQPLIEAIDRRLAAP